MYLFMSAMTVNFFILIMSCKKPEDKERKARSNRGTINNVMQQCFLFFRNVDIVTFVEKMCGATFYIKGATF